MLWVDPTLSLGRVAAPIITAVDQKWNKEKQNERCSEDLQISKSAGFNMPIHLVS